MSTRSRTPIIIASVIGVILLVLGIVYLVTPAAHLPSWLPGHLPTRTLRNGHVIHPKAHIGRGVALVVAAIAVFAATWWYAYKYDPTASATPATAE